MVHQIYRLEHSQLDSPRVRRFREYWQARRTAQRIVPLRADLDRALAGDALVIDARPVEAHAVQRIPGSLSVPGGSSFGTWLGWMVDADRPVVLLLDALEELDGIARQALRIGFESIVLPGVTIGEGAIVGCRSVVAEDVPPYTIVAGNPARVVRRVQRSRI